MKIFGIVTGALTAILGIYALMHPALAFLTIGWYVAFLLLSNGIQSVAMGMQKGEKRNAWALVLGVLSILCGVATLMNVGSRLFTDAIIVGMVGFLLVFSGVGQIMTAFARKKAGESWAMPLVVGIASILIGCLSVGHPFVTAISLGYVIGLNFFMQGISILLLTFAVKKTEPSAQ